MLAFKERLFFVRSVFGIIPVCFELVNEALNEEFSFPPSMVRLCVNVLPNSKKFLTLSG
jgi:hypothetical protein